MYARQPSSSRSGPTRTNTDDGQRHHHRRRTHKFPPQEYSDLTRTDLALIAPILLPPKAKEPRSAYEKRIKRLTADLPVHLQCKHPLLSTFCNLHSKLSPIPVTSLFTSLREEIEDEVSATWGPLVKRQQLSSQKREMVEIVQQLAVIWLGPKVFKERFGSEARRAFANHKPSKCPACILVTMAGDFQTQVAMASLFIGRVNHNFWDSSKRIQWFLERTSARLPLSRREDAKLLIWELGKKFRITRLGAEETKNPRKKAKLEAEEESELGTGTATYALSLDRELREEGSKGPRKLIGSSEHQDYEPQMGLTRKVHTSEMDDIELATQLSLQDQGMYDEEYEASWRPESSVYSRTTSGERPPSINISREIDGIYALYQEGLGGEDADDYPQLTPYGRDAESNVGSVSSLGYQPITTRSRIQSTIDRAFGDKK